MIVTSQKMNSTNHFSCDETLESESGLVQLYD